MKVKRRQFHHASGKWNRSWRLLMALILRSRRLGACCVTMTETADGKRDDVLDRDDFPIPNWDVLIDRKPWTDAEVSIAYNQKILKKVHWRVVRLAEKQRVGLPVVAGIAVFDDLELGWRYMVGTSHLPSGIEVVVRALLKKKNPAREAKAWLACVHAYRAALDEVSREFKPDMKAAGADWNVNLLERLFRVTIERIIGGKIYLAPRNSHGVIGTLGNRQIDGYVIRFARELRKITPVRWKPKSEILKAHPASDHRVIATTIPLPDRAA